VRAGSDVRVELRGLSAFGPHGVSEAERAVGCRIVLDLGFTVTDCDAASSDELAGTVDYSQVAALAAGIVRERSFRTLERLAAAVAEEVAERFEVADVEVRAAKPEPPMPEVVDEVAVVVRRGGEGRG